MSITEEFGGNTQYIEISALKGTNLQQLVKVISEQSTLMGLLEGVVRESKTYTRRGKLSTVIVCIRKSSHYLSRTGIRSEKFILESHKVFNLVEEDLEWQM